MTKILIISYFYPPANFVGAQRTAAWAKYLHEFGYYPIIITRQWNEGQTDLVDKVKNNTLEVENNQTHEVHRLPYKYSLRDRLANYPALKIFQKALTLKELVLSNYSIKQLPFSNFYTYSKKLIQNDSEIKIVIASGRPFQAFFIGYMLKKKFPGIHWVPDFRDEWSTRSTRQDHSVLQKMISALDRSSERKWVSNASFFTSVSKNWVSSIHKFTGVSGKLVMNGFESDDIAINKNYVGSTKTLSILYVGSIYKYQDFSILFNAINRFNEVNEWKAVFTFLGSYANEKERNNLESLTAEFKDFTSIIPKVSKKRVQEYIVKNDLLFLTEYKNLKGCLPVKIFDYFESDKPILLCPSDNDSMEKFILQTNSGYIANSEDKCLEIIENLVLSKQAGKPLVTSRNKENSEVYSRRYQTRRLADFLDELE